MLPTDTHSKHTYKRLYGFCLIVSVSLSLSLPLSHLSNDSSEFFQYAMCHCHYTMFYSAFSFYTQLTSTSFVFTIHLILLLITLFFLGVFFRLNTYIYIYIFLRVCVRACVRPSFRKIQNLRCDNKILC